MLVSRRHLLVSGAAAGGSLLLPRFAIGQTARPSITIAVQQVSNSASLEPLREQSNVGARIFSTIFDRLINQDLPNSLDPVPGLAESWERIDNRTLDLTLRQGVMFHNGEEMTADDVVFSFGAERMFGAGYVADSNATLFTNVLVRDSVRGKDLPAEVIAVAKRNWPALERVESVGKYKVRFINKTPDVTLEGRIARSGSDIVSQRGFADAANWLEWSRKPVGTGPYKVAEFIPDQKLVLEAHDAYWGGRPPIETITMMVVPEVASRVNGLYSREFDLICDIPPDQLDAIAAKPGFEVQGGLIPNHRLIVFDKNHPELADPRIRQAMTHAIDRQAIVDSIWSGRTSVPAGLQWEFYGPMFVEGWTVPDYDVAKATQLVKDAGYKGGAIPFRVLNNYYTNQVSTAQILVEMWRAVGLNVEIEMKENWQQVFDQTSPRGVRDWSNSAPFNDPISSIVNQHGPNGQQQQTGEWANEEMNALSNKMEVETDMAARKAEFQRMLEICEREDPAYTVLHQNATFTAKRADIEWKAAPSFAMDFRQGNFAIKA